MAQDRKVFVGGVPQDLNQDDLYAIFSEHAGVKKAWLQKCRTTDENGAQGQQNHRGFGFVIFHDALAIDELLGSAPSRFIVLRNGTKLEVKRALSSNKMSSTQADGAEVNRAKVQPPPLHMSGPPRILPNGNARTGPGRNLQGGWAPFSNNDLLRQLSLVQGNGYVPGAAPGLTANASYPQAPLPAPAMMRTGTQRVPEGRNAPLRNAIMQFYHEHRPEKLTERDFIDFICSVYEGREAELDEALRVKYGTGLQLPTMRSAADMARLPGNFEPSYVQEAWPPQSQLETARLQQLQQIQFELMSKRAQWSDALEGYTNTTCGTGSLSSLEGSRGWRPDEAAKLEEAPDFSWIDQIVGEDGLEVSDEVAKAIVGKSATKHRAELLRAVVW